MSITVFADVILPNNIIAAGVRGKNVRRNDRVRTDSGIQSINVGWTATLREFEIGIAPMRVDQWQTLETLHEITEGGAYGLLMEDPKDCLISNGVLVAAEGGGYQLTKRYHEPRSGRTKDRPITRPQQSGLSIRSNGAPVSFTVDVLTGKVTIAGSPDPATLSWSGRFYLPVHFMDDMIDWELVAPGSADARYAAGPSVILQEIRE